MVQGKQIIYGANVEFRQSSKPTVRSDGSALVAGDRWLATSDRLWFYWDGTYWLSEVLTPVFYPVNALTTSGFTPGGFPVFSTFNYWIERFDIAYNVASGTLDGSSYWTFNFARDTSSAATIEASYNLNSGSSAIRESVSQALGIHRDVSALGIKFFRCNITRTGSPPALNNSAMTFYYRLAKP